MSKLHVAQLFLLRDELLLAIRVIAVEVLLLDVDSLDVMSQITGISKLLVASLILALIQVLRAKMNDEMSREVSLGSELLRTFAARERSCVRMNVSTVAVEFLVCHEHVGTSVECALDCLELQVDSTEMLRELGSFLESMVAVVFSTLEGAK